VTRVRIPLVSDAPIVLATLVSRPTQLVIEARIDHQVVLAHLADRGSLDAWLVPGAPLLLAVRTAIGQKKVFHVAGVYVGDELIALDTLLPQRLIAAALDTEALPQFARYTKIQPQ
jgi:DNA-binding protein, stimulates sugar fermentation